ncbi:MAG: tol-pal system protein YbgF [Gammaproteobacteria bacterium]|nr:tol-pal system protein YbgF [Gammaproteobacteria bacterium]
MSLGFQDRLNCAAMAAQFAFTVVLAASVALAPAVVLAAAPVVESVAGDRRAVVPVPTVNPENAQPGSLEPGVAVVQDPPEAAGESQRLSELFYQLQILRQEVQEVRGMLEEQSHRLNRIARDQQAQYIDLDSRVAALRNNTSAPTISTPGAQVPTSPASSDGDSERKMYTDAFNLMKNREFDQSANAFNTLIVDYPNGQFTPNAFYWLGELYLAKTEFEKARQSFTQVANLYPDHQKVPDALYKLGVVYHRLGDTQRSLEYLDKVNAEHPSSSAASLAQSYAAELR